MLNSSVKKHTLTNVLIRADSWDNQQTNSYTKAKQLFSNHSPEAARKVLLVAVEEAREPFDAYLKWIPELELYCETNGLHKSLPEKYKTESYRDWKNRWEQHILLFNQAVEIGVKGDIKPAHELINKGLIIWRNLHDELFSIVNYYISHISDTRGQDHLPHLWEKFMSPFLNFYQKLDIANVPWKDLIDWLVTGTFAVFHGHLSGNARDGSVKFEEHEDRYVLKMAPCGSGGLIFNSPNQIQGGLFNKQTKNSLINTYEDWAWNTLGVCGYCTHCCYLQQLKPIEEYGFPLRVIEPPHYSKESEQKYCQWTIYKAKNLIPEKAYTAVGKTSQ